MKTFAQFILIIGLLFFFNSASHAQEWVRQHPFDIISRLNDIEIDETGFGWAVGENCSILYTENHGELWVLQDTPDDQYPLNAIAYVEGSNGQKVFAGGNIFYKTENGGQSWEQVLTGISILTILDIDVLSPDVIIVSASGGVIRSEDGGETWTELGDFSDVIRSSCWLDLQNGYILSSDKVFKTADGGITWDSIYGMDNQFFNTVEFLDANIGYIQGSEHTFKTTDGGVNWEMRNTESVFYSANDFCAASENDLFISFNNGAYLGAKSTDGGQTWTNLSTDNFSGRSYGVFVQDPNVWIVGANARIGFSEDGGTTFIDQIPGNKNTLQKVDFVDDQFGFAVGGEGLVLRTTNGGMIWEELYLNPDNPYTFDVDVYDTNYIWITSNAGLFRSTDGGETWSQLSDANSIKAVYAIDQNTLIHVVSLGIVYRSTDGGETWTEISSDPIYNAQDIEFVDDQTGWISGGDGQLLKTTDGGLSWELQQIGADINLGGVDFVDSNTGWVIPDVFFDSIWHTSDGGASWTAQYLGGNTFWNSVAFQDANHGWAVGGGSGIGKIQGTSDGGQTWTVALEDVAPFYDIDAPLATEAIVWAVGGSGNIMKLAPCASTPILDQLIGDATPCIGDTIAYEVVGTDISLYDWTLPDGWNIFGNSNTALVQIIIGSQSGQLSIQGSNTCENSNILTLDLNPVTSPDQPQINFDGLTLSTTAIADSYQWYRDGAASSDDPSFIPQFSGIYSLVVTLNGCVSPPSEELDVLVTNASQVTLAPLRLIPNPSNGKFFMESPFPNQEMSVIVNDLAGTIVYQNSLQSTTLDLSHLAPGLYLIQLKTNTKSYLGKVVIK
jgi:photosystem II stability/assembly factor-like uncharacterized protein